MWSTALCTLGVTKPPSWNCNCSNFEPETMVHGKRHRSSKNDKLSLIGLIQSNFIWNPFVCHTLIRHIQIILFRFFCASNDIISNHEQISISIFLSNAIWFNWQESRGKRPLKIWDCWRIIRKGIVVGSFEELVVRGKRVWAHDPIQLLVLQTTVSDSINELCVNWWMIRFVIKFYLHRSVALQLIFDSYFFFCLFGYFENCIHTGKDKLGVPASESVRIVLDCDGTQIEDGEYFRTLANNTVLILLRQGDRWYPNGVDVIRAGKCYFWFYFVYFASINNEN